MEETKLFEEEGPVLEAVKNNAFKLIAKAIFNCEEVDEEQQKYARGFWYLGLSCNFFTATMCETLMDASPLETKEQLARFNEAFPDIQGRWIGMTNDLSNLLLEEMAKRNKESASD